MFTVGSIGSKTTIIFSPSLSQFLLSHPNSIDILQPQDQNNVG